MLLALLPLISCFCFLFLSAILYHSVPKCLLGTFLHGSPPTGLPTPFLPLQGEAAQEAKVWLQKQRNHMCSQTGEQRGSSALLQASVLFPCVERKGRRAGEAKQKSSSPKLAANLNIPLAGGEGYCFYCCDCSEWVSGVDNILLTCRKQRRKFIADSCKLANINKSVRRVWKEKSLRCLDQHKK